MNPHCSWCAKGNRPIVLALARAGVRVSDIARHYEAQGLKLATCIGTVIQARKRGCIPSPECIICAGPASTPGGTCKAAECRKAKAYARERHRRDKLKGMESPRGLPAYRDINPVTEWPKLKAGLKLGRPAKLRYVNAPPLCPTLGSMCLFRKTA